MSRAVVTGGSRGIGLAAARRFAAHGVPTVLVSRSAEALEAARAQLQRELGGGCPAIDIRAADVGVASDVEELCKELSANGPVSHLVNAAGIAPSGLLMAATDEAIQKTLATNLVGAMLMSRGLLRGMVRQRAGSIVNVASVVGVRMGSTGQTVYAASKAGLEGFTRSLAREVGPKGVRVNTIAPGFVETDMTAGINNARREMLLKNIPLGRFGTPDEIADAIYFLATSPFVTGHTLVADGGQTA
ncbi:hypothetical protein HK105_207245 [Polyrhizophydium stewartii]|uniref:Ketoreductase domain-containing protein n=1 Tax=Polyrhizophydium stewartii TaxID=2732419 RepID=A0ABR4N142_9FUNG|nr:reductase [Polyrhizophydium stewartii]